MTSPEAKEGSAISIEEWTDFWAVLSERHKVNWHARHKPLYSIRSTFTFTCRFWVAWSRNGMSPSKGLDRLLQRCYAATLLYLLAALQLRCAALLLSCFGSAYASYYHSETASLARRSVPSASFGYFRVHFVSAYTFP
jgi:hypothetical protein